MLRLADTVGALSALLVLCDTVTVLALVSVATKRDHAIHSAHDLYARELAHFHISSSVADIVLVCLARQLVAVLCPVRAGVPRSAFPRAMAFVASSVFLATKAGLWSWDGFGGGEPHVLRSCALVVALVAGVMQLSVRTLVPRDDPDPDGDDGDDDCYHEASGSGPKQQKGGKKKKKKDKKVFATVKRVATLAGPEKGLLALGMVALFLSTGSQMYVPYILGRLISIVGEDGSSAADLDHAVWTMLVAFLAGAVCACARGVAFTVAGERLVARLRRQLFWAVVSQEIGFFDSTQSGELVNRLSADTTVIQDIATVNVSMGMRWFAQAVIGIVILFVISWRLTMVMLAAVPPVSVLAVVYGRFTRRVSKEYQKALADAGEVAAEVLSNMKTVRSIANGEWKEHERYSSSVNRSYERGKVRAMAYGGWSGVVMLFAYLAITLVLWYGGREVLHGHMEAGFLTSFLLYTIYIAVALGGLADLFTKLMTAVGASERMFELVDRRPSIPVEGGAWPSSIEGRIRLHDVTFAYPQRKDVVVLKNVNLECNPSEVVALVGRSGAGKSTIVGLVERFYDPDSGTVSIDGVDVRSLDPRWLHRNVALVAQEPVLFACSIADNISYGVESCTKEQIIEAAKLANAHDFICAFPEQYDTLVGERGVQLSGGQKQRVAIARAVLADPKILLLDEATSALDAESEHLVQAAIDSLMRNRTVVVVAHRLSTVRNASQVVVLDGTGKIAQKGTHEELVRDRAGLYHNLVRRQLQGAEHEEEHQEQQGGRGAEEQVELQEVAPERDGI